METVQSQTRRNGHQQQGVGIASHVLAALDVLESDERDRVVEAFGLIERYQEGDGSSKDVEKLADTDSLYVLRAVPTMWIFFRMRPGERAQVTDIASPEAIKFFAGAVNT